jgi:hypothetical protein
MRNTPKNCIYRYVNVLYFTQHSLPSPHIHSTSFTTNMNVTMSFLHPVYKSQWMVSLEKLYNQLLQQHNTDINQQSQKYENPRFDLIYDVQIKHACPLSTYTFSHLAFNFITAKPAGTPPPTLIFKHMP